MVNRRGRRAGGGVDGLCNFESPPAIFAAALRGLSLLNAIQEICPFHFQGLVRLGKFESVLLRCVPKRYANPVHQAFRAIRPAQAGSRQITVLCRDFEAKRILPTRPTGMQLGHASLGIAKKGKYVVLQRCDRPIAGVGDGLHLYKFTGKPSEEIEGVHSLIKQLPAAGTFRLCSPLPLVPGAASVSVYTTQKVKTAELSTTPYFVSLLQCRVITMVVAHFEGKAATPGGQDGGKYFLSVAPERLFTQHMFAGLESAQGNEREKLCRG